MEFKFGADPELFVVDSNGKPVSAHGLLEGTKKSPMIVEGGALQVDGMALEFNINPLGDVSQAYSAIRTVVEQLKMFVPEGCRLSAQPVAEFGKAYINEQPDVAKELGCDPDFNAWADGAINPTPDVELPFRTGSGHIHIGWTSNADVASEGHMEACIWVAKQLDYCLGIPSLLFGDPEQMKKRRNLYGKAGCFRPKSYGMEYRTLDNYWMRSKKHTQYVFQMAAYAVDCLERGYHFFNEDMSGLYDNELPRIINDCDVTAAKKAIEDSYVLKKFEIPNIYTGKLLK